jgi:hypothetical protein
VKASQDNDAVVINQVIESVRKFTQQGPARLPVYGRVGEGIALDAFDTGVSDPQEFVAQADALLFIPIEGFLHFGGGFGDDKEAAF